MGIPNPLAERMQEMGGDTIVIIGGSSSVGQYGTLLLAPLSNHPSNPSNPILQTRRILQHHHNRLHNAQPGPQITGRDTRHRPPTVLPSYFRRDIGNYGRPANHVRL